MSQPPPPDDPEEQLVLDVLDSDAPDPARPPAGPTALVHELVRVRAIIQAFDSLSPGPVAAAPPLPKWGPFVLREELGRGRFGIVCRGFDPAVQRDVAVKLYSGPELPTEPRLMARVRHPNVVTVLGAAIHDDRPGIWMEYVHGQTLGHRLQADGPLSPDEVLHIGIAIADALAAVHDARLIHQDVKAHNVMQEDNGRVVLMDFGTGRHADDDDRAERRSGTPVYMAPEVLLGGRPSVESDVYSLGVLLYYLLTGTYPVCAPDVADLRRLHERHHRAGTRRFVASLHELRPEVSPALSRCLAKALAPVGQRYPTAKDLGAALDVVRLGVSSRPYGRVRLGAAAVALTALGLAAGYRIGRPGAPRTPVLRHLTVDDALATDPALSTDGKWVAYASDRKGMGNLDLWVQQLAGGQPLRLTSHLADDSQPSFSPDGSRIVFRSERSDPGLYIIPTLGGEAHPIATGGRWPRFSPDGRLIAYINEAAGITILTSDGRPVRELRVKTPPEAAPVWSPDSRHVLVVGEGLEGAPSDWGGWDWVTIDIGSGAVVQTGAADVLGRQRRWSEEQRPNPWTWRDGHIFFEASHGDAVNLWRIDIDGSGRVRGPATRLTTAPGIEHHPAAVTDDELVFSTQAETRDLWDIALAPDGTSAGEPSRLDLLPTRHLLEGISEDGRLLTFVSQRLGRPHVWLKDFRTGTERPLTDATISEGFPVITRDGSGVFYQQNENDKASIHYVRTTDSLVRKLCDDCGFPTDVSPDGRYLILQHAYTSYGDLELLDVASGRRTPLLSDREYTLYRGHFSGDGKWVVFHAAGARGGTQEFIAPLAGTDAIPSTRWIPLTDGSSFTDAARWSVDANAIYYLSERDGHLCIWLQRLDATTKRPVGAPSALYHAHSRQRSLANAFRGAADLAVARDKIVFSMGEIKGDIWSVQFR
jgi:serine/threonine protein kinase